MKRYKVLPFVLTGLVLLASLACQAVTRTAPPPPAANPTTVLSQPSTVSVVVPDLVSLEGTLIELYENSVPGVVSIKVLTELGEGLGSGFLYDQEGHIVTNFHVVQGVSELEVDFTSGLKVRGEVVGTDLDSDIAVIKVDIPPEELFPLPLGNSSEVKVGQTVVAIGSPFGLNGSMTVGIVSSLGRTLDSMREAPSTGGSFFTSGDLIQTDAAINIGNSGGPLMNLRGEVIGVNRAIRTENFSTVGDPVNTGVGFAISINIVKRVVPSLIAEGEYDYPYLGIFSLKEIGLIEQETLGLPQVMGAYINDISEGGPADLAGLRGGSEPTQIPGVRAGGDLIIAVDGESIYSFGEMLSYLINYKNPGDTVLLTILRAGKEMEVNLTLGKRP